ncbi:uncharacterized protein [Dermacentor albipictus]|uniref:uncharacterized protein isoform X3 n=1 Tax=Dermacentor albipictus TaxID=60249 RepID=UPI0038FC5C4E
MPATAWKPLLTASDKAARSRGLLLNTAAGVRRNRSEIGFPRRAPKFTRPHYVTAGETIRQVSTAEVLDSGQCASVLTLKKWTIALCMRTPMSNSAYFVLKGRPGIEADAPACGKGTKHHRCAGRADLPQPSPPAVVARRTVLVAVVFSTLSAGDNIMQIPRTVEIEVIHKDCTCVREAEQTVIRQLRDRARGPW